MKVITFQDIDTLFDILIKKKHDVRTATSCKYPINGWYIPDDTIPSKDQIINCLKNDSANGLFISYILDIPNNNNILTNFNELVYSLKHDFLYQISIR